MGIHRTGASIDRLKFCNFKLDSLLDITIAINSNQPTNNLLNRYETLLRKELNIGKVLVYGYDNKEWKITLQSGCNNVDFSSIDVTKDLLVHTEIVTTFSLKNEHLKPFDVIIPIQNNEKPLAFVLIGDIEEKEGVSPTIKHLHFIQILTNIIIVAIENKRLIKENLQQERLQKELEMATKMQEMLIPSPDSLPKIERIKFEAFYLPHYEVGGDYYDCGKLSEDELFFCVADVSGKGMSAALLMSNFQANLRALFTADINLKELVIRLNDRVNQSANGEKFLTLFVAKFNCLSRDLTYINAGHVAPILYNITNSELNLLNEGCLGIGMVEEIASINVGTIKIENNSKMLCFTDGLIELEFDDQIQSVQKSVELCMASDRNVKETIQDVILELKIHKNNPALFDDITILGIDFI